MCQWNVEGAGGVERSHRGEWVGFPEQEKGLAWAGTRGWASTSEAGGRGRRRRLR